MADDLSLSERVLRVESILAIERLIAELGRAFDNGPSAEALRVLFSGNATFQIDNYATLQGADAIAAGVVGNSTRGFRWTAHYLVSPVIDLSADAGAATVSFKLWETATAASGRAYWIGGSYEARVINTSTGWRFERLELRADLISHYAAGWCDKPAELAQA